ncbi:MAG: leucyl aminopeptidase family protein, partial [Pseudomonadota bacterium]|nr:leucyl aminopeptidase family protein [Pseudomonadota bacterium]
MPFAFADSAENAIPLHVIETAALDGWCVDQPESVVNWIRLNGFSGKLGSALLVPGETGPIAVVGYGDADARARGRYALAGAAKKLPEGTYDIVWGLPEHLLETEC